MSVNPFLLPDGIEEVLLADAKRLELLRRQLLNLYNSWGYQLVMPPLVEYLESLLTGTGHDLDLQTFKITDQLTGRMMGVRADITPQVARIDAHYLQQDIPTRLCYMGSVLRTRTDGLSGSRNPLQTGAELYGHPGLESDVEVICLMLETLHAAGLEDIYIDLGHVTVYRELSRGAELDAQSEMRLFDMLQRKALPEMREFFATTEISKPYQKMFEALIHLNGDVEVLHNAQKELKAAGKPVQTAIEYLMSIAKAVQKRQPAINLHIDLAELRGYHYKTGVVFAAFVPGFGQEIARGGRYDDISKVFGKSRPATGFSMDMKALLKYAAVNNSVETKKAILAPNAGDADLEKLVTELRANDEMVIYQLFSEKMDLQAGYFDRVIRKKGSAWIVETI